MDDLDLPKDRANLFEALDADSSGALHLAELAQGLLKVRGELKKLSLGFHGISGRAELVAVFWKAVWQGCERGLDSLLGC